MYDVYLNAYFSHVHTGMYTVYLYVYVYAYMSICISYTGVCIVLWLLLFCYHLLRSINVILHHSMSLIVETAPTTQPTTSGPSTSPPTSALSTGSTGTTQPYMWSCNFDDTFNRYCGMMLRNNGVSFKTGTRSLVPSTGPSSDHTGSGIPINKYLTT